MSDNRFEIERALKTLTRSGCETFTSGIGSCWNDRQLGAQYSADFWCPACTAMYVLALLGAGQPAAAEPQYPAPHPDEPVAGARAVQAALTSALVDATGLPSADAWRYVDQARRELHPDGARVTMRGCYDMLRRAVSLADDGSLS